MIRPNRAGIFTAVLSAVAMLVALAPAGAQEVTDSHLKAARAAVTAIRASDQFDIVLPAAADALKRELIQRDPNLVDLITKVVDEQTLAMVSRRADIEKETALAYARAFTEPELNEIAAFYQTPTGQKLIAQGSQVMQEVVKSGTIWQRGVARDLSAAVEKAMQAARPKPAAQAGAAQPAKDNAPATGDDTPASDNAPATDQAQ